MKKQNYNKLEKVAFDWKDWVVPGAAGLGTFGLAKLFGANNWLALALGLGGGFAGHYARKNWNKWFPAGEQKPEQKDYSAIPTAPGGPTRQAVINHKQNIAKKKAEAPMDKLKNPGYTLPKSVDLEAVGKANLKHPDNATEDER